MQALLLCEMMSTKWSSMAKSGAGAGNGNRLKVAATLRASHCQTALLGKRGGGRGGGARLLVSPPREECSEPKNRKNFLFLTSGGYEGRTKWIYTFPLFYD